LASEPASLAITQITPSPCQGGIQGLLNWRRVCHKNNMNLKYMLSASLAVFMLALSCHAANPISKFSELSKTDRLAITYTELGCFHIFQWELTFYPKDDGYFEATEVLYETAKNGNIFEKGKEPRGRIILEKGEKKKLDALLNYYRSPIKDDNNVSSIAGFGLSVEIKQLRGDKVIAEETFKDNTLGPTKDSGILTFFEMTKALKKAQNSE